jgi:general nucleoside transport system ATP-binding protein
MSNETILEMRGIHKLFGPVAALDDVDLEVRRGEIHGLLGGNGAGKTTLMNVLYGLYKPDGGEVVLNGRSLTITSPKEAIQQGIGMVHQQFLQVNSFSVTENIVLGTDIANRPTMSLTKAEARIRQLSEEFGLVVNPRAIIEDLPMGIRQRVEILKALYRGVSVLILDEPTTNLTPQEVDGLFRSLRVMVESGLSVIFITHKLREVLSVCDRISVLRNGRRVLTLAKEAGSEDAFVQAMVGDTLNVAQSLIFAPERIETEVAKVGSDVVVDVVDMTVLGAAGLPVLKNINLQIREREILGIAGVAGNGQKELAESLLALRPLSSGRAIVGGMNVALVETRQLMENGVTYIPEDRWADGFLPTANVAQNLILGLHRQRPYSNGRFLNWGRITQAARHLITEFNIVTQGPEDTAGNLSGGNIQRMMLARAFSHSARLLIAHNPTRGLDIPSIEFVYKRLLARKQGGLTTLLISEDMDEMFLLCNRIAVIFNGEIVDILERHQFNKYQIGRLMSGIRAAE